MKTASVVTFPRVHISLIDLGDATGRRYGGVGFALEGLETTAVATVATENRLIGPASFQRRDVVDVSRALDRVSHRLGIPFEVTVACGAPSHSGFGTKTSTVFAALMACNALAGSRLDRHALVELSRRGGTSGVGVNTAFLGGLVADAGSQLAAGRPFLPSAAAEPGGDPPPAIVTMAAPEEWRVHVFMPEGRVVAGEAERDFFLRNTPIPRQEVLEVLALVYHGVVPAFVSASLPALKLALSRIQGIGFKRREVEYQGAPVAELLESLNGLPDVAAGMSSLGPMVYAIGACSDELVSLFEARYGSLYLAELKVRNQGSCVTISTSP